MSLDEPRIELYSRQIILREVGGTGQNKLLAARCLLLGAGAAHQVAASYLAGAGVGALDLWPPDPSGGAGALPALAPLEERSADARVAILDATVALADDRYDVVGAGAPGADAAPRPRLGSLAVRAAPAGAVDLIVLPGAATCLACLDPVAAASDPEGHASMPALASAGALAALACCRFLLGLDADSAPRALRLAPGAVAWTEHAPPLVARCARGCPPRGESV